MPLWSPDRAISGPRRLPRPRDGRSASPGTGAATAVRPEQGYLSPRGCVRCADHGLRPRVIGIDDWAWRKGQRYGTLICDLERRAVIELLPDREPATVAAWLRQHPQIEVVARDRNGGYRQAIFEALPDATQVADRCHLLQNASDAFLVAVRRTMPAIRKTACSAELDSDILTAAERLQFEGFHWRQKTNVLIRRMGSEAVPIKPIARITGLSRGLVRRVLRGEREHVFRLRQSSLTPWFPLLEKHWLDGCRNGAELWRRLRSNGFQGSLRVVGEWVTRQRRAAAAIPHGSGKCPPSRKIARTMALVGTISRRPTAYSSRRSSTLCRNWRRTVGSSMPSPPWSATARRTDG